MEHPPVPADGRELAAADDPSVPTAEEWRANLVLLLVLTLTPWIVIASLIRIGLRFF